MSNKHRSSKNYGIDFIKSFYVVIWFPNREDAQKMCTYFKKRKRLIPRDKKV